MAGSSPLSEADKRDLCASFQYTVAQTLTDRLKNAMAMYHTLHPDSDRFVLAGGVAANQYLRGALTEVLNQQGMTLYAPPIALCTDNAAMIAWAGIERFRLGFTDSLAFEPRARWPLASLAE